jgi:NitT/TauT family transport system substrate-binding protein
MIRQFALVGALLVMALPAAAQPKNDTVSVGYVLSLAQAPYFIALEKGYFTAEHITIDSGSFNGAQDTVSALATGKLDVSMGAVSAGFFNAQSRKLDLRAVAALGIEPGPVISTPPLVLKELWDSGKIRTGADLRGRKVAINVPGSIPEYLLTLILQKYKMTPADVDVTVLGFPQQVVALHNKAIDAAFVPEPFATMALREGVASLLRPEASVGSGDITTMIFFSGHFMRDRTDVAVRFLRAVLRGARETQGGYNKNPAIAALLAKATGLKAEDIEHSIPFAYDPNLDITHFEDSMRRQEHVHMLNKRIIYQQPLPMDQLVDATLIHKAAASLAKH